MNVTLNPGFIPILAALLMLALPKAARAPVMALAGLLALWRLLDRDFGESAGVSQVGIKVVPLQLDALNQIFGIALLIALVVIAAYSSARRSRFEDSAILMLAGGTVSALFAGDFVLFVAAASLSGLGAAWVVFAAAREDAARAGVRLLIWNGLEGLFLLVGVALHIAGNGAYDATITRLDAASLSGGFIFAGVMIRVGAPLAHVWLKDVIAHATPTGAAALCAFAPILGIYALARFFPAEALLVPIGAAMIAIGAFFAAAEDDLRAASAYALSAHLGICVALVGVGGVALAAVEVHAFAAILAFTALQMALGGLSERRGDVRASALAGAGRTMPVSAALLLLAGLAAAGAPGFALYATLTATLEAVARWETRWLWLMFLGLSACLFISLVLRPALILFRGGEGARMNEAPYGMLLGTALAIFFCLAIGLSPQWLFSLTPGALVLEPFALDRVARHLSLLGAAGIALIGLRVFRATPAERPVSLYDVDALYRGPVASAGRWLGAVGLRVFGAAERGLEILGVGLAAAIGRWLRSLDRPYGAGAGAVSLAAVALLVGLAILALRAK